MKSTALLLNQLLATWGPGSEVGRGAGGTGVSVHWSLLLLRKHLTGAQGQRMVGEMGDVSFGKSSPLAVTIVMQGLPWEGKTCFPDPQRPFHWPSFLDLRECRGSAPSVAAAGKQAPEWSALRSQFWLPNLGLTSFPPGQRYCGICFSSPAKAEPGSSVSGAPGGQAELGWLGGALPSQGL